MPNPKDPEKFRIYREKMRAIALERGYGKWMIGKRASVETVEKMRSKQLLICSDPEERKKRSERAKKLGIGKWMKGRKNTPFLVKAKEEAKKRKGKKYSEIYGGKIKGEIEARKRRVSNKARFIGVPKKVGRPKHNGTGQYARWRKKVFERDEFTCQRCGKKGGFLHAHHIKLWSKFPKFRYTVSNGKTLCAVPCHVDEHKEMKLKEIKNG